MSIFGLLTHSRSQDNRTFVWEDLTEQISGIPPPPRLDHSAVVYPITPNSDTFDKLLIMGGRDLNQMFQDAYCLDLTKMAWEDDVKVKLWMLV